jgi:hypothetical protein
MLGAEALARPPSLPAAPLHADAHHLAWTSTRFRAYDVRCEDAVTEIEYGVHGLLVTFIECDLVLPHKGSQGCVHIGLRPGAYVWVEPPLLVRLPPLFRGIFAEWI